MTKKVEIYYKNILAGILTSFIDGDFEFTYDHKYLENNYPEISHTLPTNTISHQSSNFFPFFDGLIPEGWILNLASKQLKLNPLSKRFELFKALCGDTIGAVHIHKETSKNIINTEFDQETNSINLEGKCHICYAKIEDNNDYYHQKCRDLFFETKNFSQQIIDIQQLEEIAKQAITNKQSITGVQKKLSLDIVENNKKLRMTFSGLNGRFILKPKSDAPHLPENEHLIMMLARETGIETAECALMKTSNNDPALIIKRFDRDQKGNFYHQEDFCQIFNKEPFKKYQGSIEQVGKLVKGKCSAPGNDLYRLLELTLFNFIIGNVDFHLKNISLKYQDEINSRTRLSPAYDLLSTSLFISDDEQSALAINGKKNKLTKSDFNKLSTHLGIKDKVFKSIIHKIQSIKPIWWNKIDQSFLNNEDKIKLKDIIEQNLHKLK